MFDGLQNRNVATVTLLSLIYFVILVGSVSLGIIQVYLRMALQRRWRAWLNGQPIDRWLAQGRYYQLNLLTGDHTNPEYRIADDVRIATVSSMNYNILICGYCHTVRAVRAEVVMEAHTAACRHHSHFGVTSTHPGCLTATVQVPV